MSKSRSILILIIVSINSLVYAQDLTSSNQLLNDSLFFKNRGIYLTVSPLMLDNSINTDTKEYTALFSARFGVNWITKKYHKFRAFVAHGYDTKIIGYGMETYEFGLTYGKLRKGKNAGFWDLNFGLSYYGRIPIDYLTPSHNAKVREVHTMGIPFEASVFSSKLPLGLGVGIAGNLNIVQPYIGLLVSVRIGNPVSKLHST